jgi:hypothetical protein
MERERNATGRNSWTIIAVGLGFFALYAMYFLSAGPMIFLASRHIVTPWFFNTVYYPNMLLAENCYPFGWLWKATLTCAFHDFPPRNRRADHYHAPQRRTRLDPTTNAARIVAAGTILATFADPGPAPYRYEVGWKRLSTASCIQASHPSKLHSCLLMRVGQFANARG